MKPYFALSFFRFCYDIKICVDVGGREIVIEQNERIYMASSFFLETPCRKDSSL
jgi:hypothetical protein